MAAAAGENKEVKSENKEVKDEPDKFDIAIRALHKCITDLHDTVNGRVSSDRHALWMVRTSNFMTAYSKVNKPSAFKGMFLNFFNENKTSILAEIFTEREGRLTVNDKWLRTTKDFEAKAGAPQNAQDSSWTPGGLTCKGLVIYFNPKRKSVSIPISEIYIAAVSLAKEKGGSDNVKAYSFPPRVLKCLYSIFEAILSEGDNDMPAITHNLTLIKGQLDDIIPDSDEKTEATGEGIAGFTKIISSLTKSMGVDLNLDAKQIEGTIGNVLGGDTFANLGKIVNKVVDSVKDTKTNDVGAIISGIGNTLSSDPELKTMLAAATGSISSSVNSLQASIPTQTNPISAPPSIPDNISIPMPPASSGAENQS